MNSKPTTPRARAAASRDRSADELIGTLMTFGRFMRRLLTSSLPDSCSVMQLKTLEFIRDSGEPSMRDVADEMKISSPAVTMIIDHLVEDGGLARVADKSDRRIIRLAITPKGLKELDKGMKTIRALLKERIANLSASEREHMASAMERFMK